MWDRRSYDARNFQKLGLPNCAIEISAAIFRDMRPCVSKILSIVLALVIGFGPASSVMAKDHACGVAVVDSPMVSEHKGHSQHRQGTHEDSAQERQADTCKDCGQDCCIGATCSASTCSGGTATVSHGLSLPLATSGRDAWSDETQTALGQDLSSLFRPPRV